MKTFIRPPALRLAPQPLRASRCATRSGAPARRRGAERRPRRRLRRDLVPRGRHPGRRVRAGRRRPPRPRRVGLDLLAGALPPARSCDFVQRAAGAGAERAGASRRCGRSRADSRERRRGARRSPGRSLIKRAALGRGGDRPADRRRGRRPACSCRSTSVAGVSSTSGGGRDDRQTEEITPAEAGEPQTIMILGTDKRARRRPLAGDQARSDTIILARLDADKDAITLMSIPRDLKVDDPGLRRTRQDQRGLRRGGAEPRRSRRSRSCSPARPAVQDQPRRQGQLQRLPADGRLLGCVYVDIDRRYFNDSRRARAATRDRHRARLPEALRPGRARLRALPPHRQRPRPRRAPAGLHAPGCSARRASASA